jgi:hypothetical protein
VEVGFIDLGEEALKGFYVGGAMWWVLGSWRCEGGQEKCAEQQQSL